MVFMVSLAQRTSAVVVYSRNGVTNGLAALACLSILLDSARGIPGYLQMRPSEFGFTGEYPFFDKGK